MKKRHFKGMSTGLLLLIIVIITGILGYILIEKYTFVEALYMTLITMATVGFGEVHPLSDAGRIFTSLLIIFSFGIFAYVITAFSRYVIDGAFRNYFIDNKVKKRISKLKGHVIVCGYGRNGNQAVVDLIEHKEQVIIIEKEESISERLREETDLLFIHGDATSDEVLGTAQIECAKALITTLPVDADNLFVVLTAHQMNPELKIISRASDESSDVKLKRAGANNVIMPDRIGGQRMAKLVAQPDIVEFLDYLMLMPTREVRLEEVSCENIADYFVERTIRELDIRNVSGANIVGLRTEAGQYIVNPSPDTKLSSNDKLFTIGTPEQIKKLKSILCRNL
ncbi:MAG: potassium channel protein [Bacteroidia bacterium]|nr:potassium channel protein [Bacteroidia bacterium]